MAVLVHWFTTGQRLPYARVRPGGLHGVRRSIIQNGQASLEQAESLRDTGKVFSGPGPWEALAEQRPQRLWGITAAKATGTGLDLTREGAKQFFDVGIAERHAVDEAAGMATAGLSGWWRSTATLQRP